MTESKPSLLYISPVMPLPGGNGLAMRAYNVLKALAQKYHVHLLAGSGSFRCRPEDACEELAGLCTSIACIPSHPRNNPDLLLRALLHRFGYPLYRRLFRAPRDYFPLTGRIERTLNRIGPGGQIDVIHVFRLYMFPVAEFYLRGNPSAACRLDLDDVESETRRRISVLFRLGGDGKTADRTLMDAALYESIEGAILPRCRRIFVCSEIDREKLCRKYRLSNVAVVPNTVQLPAVQLSTRAPTGCSATEGFTFLFVGSMGYYPNRDAVLFFCRQVLPLLRRMTTRTISLKLVGSGAGREIAEAVSRTREAELVGHVADVTPHYDKADAVIVPIRGGGGTRIKVLEAFAHRRPVVSTHAGMEGIDAHHEVHALLADNEQGFSAQCARLMDDFDLGRRLVESAFHLLCTRYHPALTAEGLFDEM